jgi:hypothetical protein
MLFHASTTMKPFSLRMKSIRQPVNTARKHTPVILIGVPASSPWHFSDTEVLMMKHRTITGLLAVALLATAVTAATLRSHSPSTDRIVRFAGMTLSKGLTVDVNKLPTEDFDDQSLVYSSKR